MDGRSRYTVQILLEAPMAIDAWDLHERLCAWRPDIEMLGERALFAIPTGDLPLLVHIFPAELDTYASSLCDALTWSPSWRWDELSRRCPASIAIAMIAQRPINHASLLLTFLAVLDIVLSSFEPALREAAVLHWLPSQQLLTYDRYRMLRIERGPCGPAVNIRIVNATGHPGELLADTVGLADLGLPDLQIVFTDRDPAEIEGQLREFVRTVFVGDRLDCGWIEESSLVPPMRDALTLQLD
ncbi:MAG: hypothetical protein WKG01_04735 [Kofleriaceae bacterium]